MACQLYKARSDGFSLLEMLIVLSVIGLSTALLTVQFNSKARQVSPQEFAQILKVRLSQERLHAVSKGVDIEVVFDFRETKMNVIGQIINEQIPKHINIDLLTGRDLVRSNEVASIKFLADGSSLGAEILIYSNNNSAKVIVNWLTGLASIDKSS